MAFKIFVVNPGGGTTKIAYFEDETRVLKEEVEHNPAELNELEGIDEQLSFRMREIKEFVKKHELDLSKMDAFVGRGGAFYPLVGGVYFADDDVVKDVKEGKVQADHPSNLGALIVNLLGKEFRKPAFFADPVSVDEFDEVSRLSGLKELERKSLAHTLNTKYVARKVAEKHGKKYEELNMVVAHLGTGISISPHRKGKMFDVNNANDGGPFSPQRTGSLPTTGLIKLCFSGMYEEKQLIKKVTRGGGLMSYLGTQDLKEVLKKMEKDEYAKLVFEAMVYQIAKEIGAMSAALKGRVDYIVLTGGMARADVLVEKLKEYIEWIAPVEVIPGENEMEALAFAALRVLRGEEKPKKYSKYVKYRR